MDAILTMEAVTFSYSARPGSSISPVLRRFGASIKKQEIVAMVGPSACGKSTVGRLLAGLLSPDEGYIKFKEELVSGPSRERGLIAQGDWCLPWLSVRGNLELGLSNRKNEQFEYLVRISGLQSYLDRYPQELSFGTRQRVCLVRALLAGADLLILDEPLSSVDAVRRLSLQDAIRETLKKAGVAALWITHDLDEALLVSDRLMVVGRRPLTVLYEESCLRSQEPLTSMINSMEFQKRRAALQQLVLKLWPIEGSLENENI